MPKLLFEIIQNYPATIQKVVKLCNGCSDAKFHTTNTACWSYKCAHVVLAKFQTGEERHVLNCYHIAPTKKISRPPPTALAKDFEMPLSREKAEDLSQVLDFFSLTMLRIEIFDAFLYAYRRGDNLTEALNFARSEWDV